jgi:hypothetical protein
MTPTPATRKPVDRLTTLDFAAFPVWEYAIDEEEVAGRDETWVRPADRARLRRGLYSQLVLSSFKTSRGDVLPGFMIVSTADPDPDVQPGALLAPRYLALPMLSRPQAAAKRRTWDLDSRRDILRALRRREDGVFPLTYQVQVPLGRGKKLLRGKVR